MGREFYDGITGLAEILFRGIAELSKLRGQNRRDALITDLLAACYTFQDLSRNGRKLLDLAGPRPLEKFSSLDGEQRVEYLNQCHQGLLTQLSQLHQLSDLINGQPIFEILDPKLKQEIDAIVGDKSEAIKGKNTGVLLRIAGALQYYLMFGPALADTEDKNKYGEEIATGRYQAHIITNLFTFEDGDNVSIDLGPAASSLEALEQAGERLRLRTMEYSTDDELLRLSKAAEKKARSPKSED